jgi:peptidyl-prolyl cis-trans isomerase C
MKQTFRAFLLSASILAAFPALAEDAKPAVAAEKPAESGKDFTIVKLGNEEIKNSEVLDIWKGLFPSGSAPDFASFDENIRQNVLRGLVSERLIYQEALKAGTDKNDDVKKRLAQAQKQIVIQSFVEQKAKTLVTDEQLKAAYQTKADAAKGQEEVKARHILVEKEEDAKKIAADLKKGGDFDKIAKEKSTDKGSGSKGGDLGWFSKEKMVPEFADAAFKMKKGETSGPVKSQFGWHIIKLEDRRPVQVASFDDMKESLRAEVTNKSVEAYVEGLLKGADIKYYSADGKEMTLSRSLSPAAGKAEDKAEEKQ